MSNLIVRVSATLLKCRCRTYVYDMDLGLTNVNNLNLDKIIVFDAGSVEVYPEGLKIQAP